jgi:TRAP-type C4-dicarboxylate transport system permease small subunit
VVERALEYVVLLLVTGLAVLVVAAVAFRKAGAALVWYDELASIMLAWLTFYGAALAARRRAHIGFPRLVESAPARLRRVLVLGREACVVGFLLAVAWAGWQVQQVLAGTFLTSMPAVPTRLAHSVIPLGALAYVLAELATVPERLAGARRAELVATTEGDPEVRRVPAEEP